MWIDLDVPENPLLYVPTHTARDLDRDLQAAGIQKYTLGGKLDFHGCRVAYINLVIESGVSVKETQALARHATPQLTMNVYGRVREERLSEVVEKVAKTFLPDEERAIYVHRKAVGADENAATPTNNKELRPIQISGGGGNRTPHLPHLRRNTSETEVVPIRANRKHIGMLPGSAHVSAMQKLTFPEQVKEESVHASCATCVQGNRLGLPDDLIKVVDAWVSLPEPVRAGILAMVNAVRKP